MITLICGFAGIGKTHLADYTKYIDFDSSIINAPRNTPLFAKEYVQSLIDYIERCPKTVTHILLSCHVEVRYELKNKGLLYTLVFPTKELRETYLERYKQRGSNEGFINLFKNNFDNFVDSCYNDPSKKIVLSEATQYLSDFI